MSQSERGAFTATMDLPIEVPFGHPTGGRSEFIFVRHGRTEATSAEYSSGELTSHSTSSVTARPRRRGHVGTSRGRMSSWRAHCSRQGDSGGDRGCAGTSR